MTTANARQTFLDAAANKHILSAYLVVCARPSVSKRLTNDFLMRLYCKKGGCGNCADCAKVREGHVDILRLTAPKVSEFRDAIAFVAQKSVEGGYKAVVIEDTDNTTDSAANSMLKTLEQPPDGTVFLLQARSASGVLPTVASRCGIVRISPDKNAAAAIQAKLGVSESMAHVLADLSGGFVSEAAHLLKDEAYWPMRSQMLALTKKLMPQHGMAISIYTDFFEKNKAHIPVLLNIMLSYCRDIAVFQKTQNAALIVNRDVLNDITQAARHFTSGAISNMIRIILETERRFLVPVNFSLAVEKALFDILEELNAWKK